MYTRLKRFSNTKKNRFLFIAVIVRQTSTIEVIMPRKSNHIHSHKQSTHTERKSQQSSIAEKPTHSMDSPFNCYTCQKRHENTFFPCVCVSCDDFSAIVYNNIVSCCTSTDFLLKFKIKCKVNYVTHTHTQKRAARPTFNSMVELKSLVRA